MALTTEKVLKSCPDLSVRVITSFSSSSEGVAGWVKDLAATQCGKWTWRISEKPSSTRGCDGSVWISEILSTGRGENSIKHTHDPRADVSSLQPRQCARLILRLSSCGVLRGCSSNNQLMRRSKPNSVKTGNWVSCPISSHSYVDSTGHSWTDS